MEDINQLQQALIAADKAGNVDDAKALAAAIAAARATSAPRAAAGRPPRSCSW